jgi:hypothetical protein
MMKRYLRTALILLMTGTFISATQSALARSETIPQEGSSESCFSDTGMLDLSRMSVESGPEMKGEAALSSFAPADTLETYEIELEDEGDKGVNYKAIIGFTIAAIFVGYALYILLVPEEEEEEAAPPGKEPPVSLITIPFGG